MGVTIYRIIWKTENGCQIEIVLKTRTNELYEVREKKKKVCCKMLKQERTIPPQSKFFLSTLLQMLAKNYKKTPCDTNFQSVFWLGEETVSLFHPVMKKKFYYKIIVIKEKKLPL